MNLQNELYSNTQTSNGLCFWSQWPAIHVESLRTMRRHLDDRQRLTFPEDSTFEIPDTLKHLPTQTSLCYLVFILFLFAVFPLHGWFRGTYPTICFRQHVDVDSPHLWQHRILSLRPRLHHRQPHHLAFPTTERDSHNKKKKKRFTCFAFDLPPPACAILTCVLQCYVSYRHEEQASYKLLNLVFHKSSRLAKSSRNCIVSLDIHRQVNKNGADSYESVHRRRQIVICYYIHTYYHHWCRRLGMRKYITKPQTGERQNCVTAFTLSKL